MSGVTDGELRATDSPPAPFSDMVHFISLYKIKKGKTDEDLEEMIRISRSCFCRLNEVHNFRSGRSIDPESPYAFFISADFESRDKLAMFQDDPNYARFEEEVVKPHTNTGPAYIFETEPGRDPRYS